MKDETARAEKAIQTALTLSRVLHMDDRASAVAIVNALSLSEARAALLAAASFTEKLARK